MQTYRTENQGDFSPYSQLEKCSHFRLLHDATSHWVMEVNTAISHGVSDDGNVFKVPYSMKRVSGSFTGEVLCAELLQEICSIRKVSHNATLNIRDAISAYNGFLASRPNQKYKQLHKCLKDGAEKADFITMMDTKNKMEELVKLHPELGNIDLKTIQLVEGTDNNPDAENPILPLFPKTFKIALLKGIEDGTIILEIDSLNITTTTCGDGCAVNLKGAQLLEQNYEIKSPSLKCGSHLSAGTIRRLCTWVQYSQQDGKDLYEKLRSILKHFSKSPKSSKIRCTRIIHLLNWGSTCMAGFLDACTKALSIILPFLDTLVTGQTHEDETKYLASPTGIYLLQLFAHLHCVFTDSYLHHVDSDDILVCEVYEVAQQTAKKLTDPELSTQLAASLFNSLSTGLNDNIKAEFIVNTTNHNITLNTKVTRHNTLNKMKTDLLKKKQQILQCMATNVIMQHEADSLMALMSAFNLESDEDYESQVAKVSALHDLYGTNTDHQLEDWHEFKVKVTYKRRLSFTKKELLDQLQKAFEKMNAMSSKLNYARGRKEKLSQIKAVKNL